MNEVNKSTTSISHSASNQGILNAISLLSIIYYPITSYFNPTAVLFSSVNNGIVLYVLIRSRLFYQKTSKNARLCYMSLAVSDTCCVYTIGLLWFLGDGLYSASGGRVYFYMDQVSTMSCKLWRLHLITLTPYSLYVSESMTGWTIVWLNVDRLIAISAPFFARRYLTERTTRLLLLCIFLFSALSAAPAFQIFDYINIIGTCAAINVSAASQTGITCVGINKGSDWIQIAIPVEMGMLNLILPTVVMLTVSLMLIRRVMIVRRGKGLGISGRRYANVSSTFSQAEGQDQLSSGGENLQHNSTLATIVQMTIVYFIVYMPFPLIWIFRNSVGFLLDSLTISLLTIIERIWLNTSEIIHVWNLWFYVSRMAIFRAEFLMLTHLKCLLCQKRSTDTSSAITRVGKEVTNQ